MVFHQDESDEELSLLHHYLHFQIYQDVLGQRVYLSDYLRQPNMVLLHHQYQILMDLQLILLDHEDHGVFLLHLLSQVLILLRLPIFVPLTPIVMHLTTYLQPHENLQVFQSLLLPVVVYPSFPQKADLFHFPNHHLHYHSYLRPSLRMYEQRLQQELPTSNAYLSLAAHSTPYVPQYIHCKHQAYPPIFN